MIASEMRAPSGLASGRSLPVRILIYFPSLTTSLLRRRAVRASVYVLTQLMLSSAIRLGGSLLLTRLLLPDAFGLMAVVYVIASGLALLSDFGVAQNVMINKDGDDERFLQTAWTLQIVRASMMCVAAIVTALLISRLASTNIVGSDTVYHQADLPWIICAFSMTLLVSGFESIKLKQAQRRLQLGRPTALELVSQLTGMVVMIAVAASYHSVWALVLGAAVSGLVKTVGSHLFFSGAPARLVWHRPSAIDLISFGKWIIVSSALTFFVQSGDRLLLGGLIDVSTLGYYSIAVILIGVVQSLYLGLMSGVMLPALSEAARASEDRVRTVFRLSELQSDAFLFTAAGFLAFAGPGIIAFLYDPRYAGAGPILSILSFSLIGMRFTPLEQYFLMRKAVHHFAIWNGARALIMCVGLPLGYALGGFQGASIMIVLTQYAAWPFAISLKVRSGLLHWPSELLGLPALMFGAGLGWAGGHLLLALSHVLRP